jgi:hypothetical protein
MRNLGNGKPHPRRRLLDGELAIAIQRRGTVWPLSADEISEWARRLGGGADNEGRLQNLVTYWFAQASSLIQVSQAAGTMTGVEPAGRRRYKGGEGRPGEGNAGYCDPRIARKPAGRRAGGSAPHEADVKADSVTPASLQRLSRSACVRLRARLRRTGAARNRLVELADGSIRSPRHRPACLICGGVAEAATEGGHFAYFAVPSVDAPLQARENFRCSASEAAMVCCRPV